jgi:peptidoglycan/LPS O-acetylase OafA/YrhL
MSHLTDLTQSKPHYEILDGLRGVAALTVVLFHILEVYSNGDHTEQLINHGYLAVDFFFLLSGYVISYAYDDRWHKMSLADFFKRRIIRLQPMVIAGSVIGALLFYFQNSPALGWSGISEVPVGQLIVMMLIGSLLIPVGKGLDIRGWNEMFPLNGPGWSLFYEYIANIMYAVVLRRLSNIVLIILMCIAACFTIQYALTNSAGDLIGGWSIDEAKHLYLGTLRLAFPFLAGMVLARTVTLKYTPHAFLSAGLLLLITLSIPRIGGHEQPWLNGLYECICLVLVFPFIIWLGAGGKVSGKAATISKFLGDISYPIYITHYPVVYIYMGWVADNGYTLQQTWLYGVLTAVVCVVLAYGTMKLYDIPFRAFLRKYFL